jgi:peptide/nickel transport system permease protein
MMRRGFIVVAKLAVSLVAIAVITFVTTNAIPGDPARLALGRGATQEQLAEFRQLQGLDEPPVQRFFTWMGNALTGDWGTSFVSRRPVVDDIRPKITRTIILALLGFAIAVPVSLLLGLYSGLRGGSGVDLGTSIVTVVAAALPEFVIGLLLLLIFAVELGWLPIESSALVFSDSWLETARAYVLPAVALALTIVPYATRVMRANTREVSGEPYVRSAILRGVPGSRLARVHVFPNAAAPFLNVIALNLAGAITGVVALEAVFGFPGGGQLLVQAVGAKDIPVVQALALLFGAFFVLLNLAADALVAVLTPKLRNG